jgi:hypothetical protein
MAAMILAALVVFYPLSSGPVYRAYYSTSAHGLVGMPDGLMYFYLPLAWACRCRPIDKFFEWYITIWMHDIDPNSPG